MAALLAVPPGSRRSLANIVQYWTLHDMVESVYPHGWQRNNQWPALRKALIQADQYRIDTGEGSLAPLFADTPDLALLSAENAVSGFYGLLTRCWPVS